MKRCIKIIISSALLLGCLVLTSCDLGDSISIRYEPKETTAPADTSSTNKPSGDNSASNTPSGDNSSSNTPSGDNSTSNTPSGDQSSNVIHYGDSCFYTIATDNGKVAKLGSNVYDLKADTTYKFTLKIDSSKMASTPFRFMTQNSCPVVYYHFDYDNNTGDFSQFVSLEKLGANENCVFELTTPSGFNKPLSFYIFEMDYQTHEGVVEAKEYVSQCIVTFDIEEIK